MRSFGTWLWKNRDGTDPDTILLNRIANQIGPTWPIESRMQEAYRRIIEGTRQIPDDAARADALAALQRLWTKYEIEIKSDLNSESAPNTSSLLGKIVENFQRNVGPIAIALVTIFLVAIFYKVFQKDFLKSIGSAEASRSLITFLFAISTVAIAVIVVLAAFLGSGEKEELDQRFQHGKDVLTVLIGVFGTIIGFYFGTAPRDGIPGAGVNAIPVATVPGAQTVTAAAKQPIRGVSVADTDAASADETITVSLSDAAGLLSTNATAGVTGAGTKELTVKGTVLPHLPCCGSPFRG